MNTVGTYIIDKRNLDDSNIYEESKNSHANTTQKPIPFKELGPEWHCPICQNLSAEFKKHQLQVIRKVPFIIGF